MRFLTKTKRHRIDTIYLHIGFHKTGSTFIQHSLYQIRDRLTEHGTTLICLNNYRKATDLGNASYLLRRLDRLKKKLNAVHTSRAIISSENMSWWGRDEINGLARLLKKYANHVVVVVYLRNHDEYAVSMKQQGAKTPHIGRVFGHDEGVLPRLNASVRSRLEYASILKKWGERFGVENVRITTFDYLKANHLSLKQSACERFELSGLELPEIPRINESIDDYWQRFLHEHQDLFFASKAVRDAMLPELIRLGSRGPKRRPTIEEQETFRREFLNDVETLQETFNPEQILFNHFHVEPVEFPFDEAAAKRVQSEFLDLQSAVAVELHQQGKLGRSEVSKLITCMRDVSKEAAENLERRLG